MSHLRALLVTTLSLGLAACASAGRLGEYSFQDRAVAVVLVSPPRPDVFTGDVFLPSLGGGLGGAILAAGGQILREREADRLRERLDEATESTDVATLMADRALAHAARLLRARAIDRVDEADFELEIRIEEYGIEADGWDSQARFFLDAEVRLLDSEDGAEIWKAGISESDPVNTAIIGLDGRLDGMVTAAALASLSVTEIERALAGLAEYCADEMEEKLRAGLEKARG